MNFQFLNVLPEAASPAARPCKLNVEEGFIKHRQSARSALMLQKAGLSS
ncbi:MAG: hypothetical protein JOZ78_08330 [Chroococcidiopsidaceae cyanobacterium CP_BM_ER_R8_30]|nr:hypothetical protein [Chroococcidiopsidaceae cyanobacterium CP_BM_ER_R8_30]